MPAPGGKAGGEAKNEEEEKMITKWNGYKIFTGFLTGNLFRNNNPAEKGIDVKKSISRFVALCREALEKEFPGAEVEIDYQENTMGYTPISLQSAVVFPDEFPEEQRFPLEEEIVETIDDVVNSVWVDGGWIVVDQEEA